MLLAQELKVNNECLLFKIYSVFHSCITKPFQSSLKVSILKDYVKWFWSVNKRIEAHQAEFLPLWRVNFEHLHECCKKKHEFHLSQTFSEAWSSTWNWQWTTHIIDQDDENCNPTSWTVPHTHWRYLNTQNTCTYYRVAAITYISALLNIPSRLLIILFTKSQLIF